MNPIYCRYGRGYTWAVARISAEALSIQRTKMTARTSSKSQKFSRDIIWVGLAQLFNSVILGLVTLPALTKSYSSEIYGIWIQINVTIALLSPFIALQLGQAAVRFLAGEEDKAKRRQALGSMLFAIGAFSCLALIITNILASQLSTLLFASPDYTIFVRLTSLWMIVNALYNFFLFYMLSQSKIKLLSIRQVAYSTITMILVIALATQGFKLEWLIVSAIVVQAIFTLAFFAATVFELGLPTPNVTGLKQYLAFSAPQIASGSLLWILSTSDRYFITHFLDLSQTGIYSSSYTLANLTILFYAPISFVLFPMVSRLWDEGRTSEVKTYLEYSTKLFTTMAIPAAAGIALLSQPLLKILTTSEFLAGRELVLLLAIGAIFLGIYQINVYIVLLVKKTKLLPLITATAAVISLMMNIILIPRIGITGAAAANIASYFVLAVIVTLWARKTVKYSLDTKLLAKVISSTVIMSLFLYFVKIPGVWGIILSVISGAAIFGICLFLLRAFSEKDKRLIRKTLGGFIPGYIKKDD